MLVPVPSPGKGTAPLIPTNRAAPSSSLNPSDSMYVRSTPLLSLKAILEPPRSLHIIYTVDERIPSYAHAMLTHAPRPSFTARFARRAHHNMITGQNHSLFTASSPRRARWDRGSASSCRPLLWML